MSSSHEAWSAVLRLGGKVRLDMERTHTGEVWTIALVKVGPSKLGGISYRVPDKPTLIDVEDAMRVIECAVQLAFDKYEADDPEGKSDTGVSHAQVLAHSGLFTAEVPWARYQTWRMSGDGYEPPVDA